MLVVVLFRLTVDRLTFSVRARLRRLRTAARRRPENRIQMIISTICVYYGLRMTLRVLENWKFLKYLVFFFSKNDRFPEKSVQSVFLREKSLSRKLFSSRSVKQKRSTEMQTVCVRHEKSKNIFIVCFAKKTLGPIFFVPIFQNNFFYFPQHSGIFSGNILTYI